MNTKDHALNPGGGGGIGATSAVLQRFSSGQPLAFPGQRTGGQSS